MSLGQTQTVEKPKRGRPKGSKNKATTSSAEVVNFVPDIDYIEMPPMLSIDTEAIKRMDSLAGAFGYTDTTISDVYRFAKLALNTAIHYQSEAERVRDSKLKGKEVKKKPRTKTASGVVTASWHQRLADDIRLGRTIAIRGAAGNGKSTGAKYVLEELGFNIYHLDCTDTTTVEQLVGGLVPEPDGNGGIRMTFQAGVVAKAFADPDGAIQLDEFDALDPRTALCLQSALHRAGKNAKRFVSLPDHEDGGMNAKGLCPIVVTMNTYGSGATREYVGRNALDSASMDRFDSILETSYENEDLIIRSCGFTGAPAKNIVNVADQIRKKINYNALRVVLSTRRLIAIAESMTEFGIDMKDAFDREFYERLEPHDRKTLSVTIDRLKAQAGSVDDPLEIQIKPIEELAQKDIQAFLNEVWTSDTDRAMQLLQEKLKDKTIT